MLRKKSTRSVTKLPKLEYPVVASTAEYVEPQVTHSVHPIHAKLANALKRAPLQEHEQLVLARLALKAIAEGARSELRDIAQSALRVVG